MSLTSASNELKSDVRYRTVLVSLALLLLTALAWTGCGELSEQDYANAAWGVNQHFGEEATSLFAQLEQQGTGGDLKADAINGLEASQRLEQVFMDSLRELEKIKPPGELRELHDELLDFYREGQALMADYTAAFDHLYNVSSILEGFFDQGLEIFEVGVLESPAASLTAALDIDIMRIEGYLDALESEAAGGSMAAFDDFFIRFFTGIRDILVKEKAAIAAGDAASRARLNAELSEHFFSFLQPDSAGLPGFDELAGRLLLLNEDFQQINSKINNL